MSNGIVTKETVKIIIKATAPASPNKYANAMGIIVKKSANIRLKSAVCFLFSFLQTDPITSMLATPNEKVINRK